MGGDMENTNAELKENLRPEADHLYFVQSIALIVGVILIAAGLAAGSLSLLTALAALMLMGLAQLSLLKLQRLGARGQLLADQKKNDWVTRWICAHLLLSTPEDDPAIYELEKKVDDRTDMNGRRKSLLRSAIGIEGVKRLRAVMVSNLGLAYISDRGSLVFVERNEDAKKIVLSNMRESIAPILLTQAVLLLALIAVGAGSAYLIWILANLTVLPLVLELKSQKWTKAEVVEELRLGIENSKKASVLIIEKLKETSAKLKDLKKRKAEIPVKALTAEAGATVVTKDEELSLADLPAPRLRDEDEQQPPASV